MLKKFVLAGIISVLVGAGVLVSGGSGGPAAPQTAEAEASFPVLLSPSICASLLAASAEGDAVLHYFFSCQIRKARAVTRRTCCRIRASR